jgi:hypothetical protein
MVDRAAALAQERAHRAELVRQLEHASDNPSLGSPAMEIALCDDRIADLETETSTKGSHT